MSQPEGNLCLECSKIRIAEYFRQELHVLRSDDGVVGPSPEAVRLCSLRELHAKASICAFCELALAALCKRWDPEEWILWEDTGDYVDWAYTLHNQPEIHLYSYVFAEDPQGYPIIRLGIGLRKPSETRGLSDEVSNMPALDHAGSIQIMSSTCLLRSRTSFYGRAIGPDRANIHLVKGWLTECKNSHQDKCDTSFHEENTTSNRTVPCNLRVVDVDSMCICPWLPQTNYIALSYCWAQSTRHFTTKRSNVEELHTIGSLQKAFSMLPGTIQDAISLVREIGERYLWVDALCIIQDDDDDKQRQIHQMGSVYHNSLITVISAPPDPANYSPYDGLPGYRIGSRGCSQVIACVQGLDLSITLVSVEQMIQRSPWSTRAWTFQEHLLSRRRLYFTEAQVYFQCPCGVFCEDVIGEGKSPSAVVYPGSSLWNLSGHYNDLSIGGQVGNAEGLSRRTFADPVTSFGSYANIVERYTDRKMSDERDSLNALEGVLSIFRTAIQTEFLQGLPEIFLDEAILWQQRVPHQRRIIIDLPSWSWAGWKGHSDYRGQFTGFIRREINWYLVGKNGAIFNLMPRMPLESSGKPFDQSIHCDVYPVDGP